MRHRLLFLALSVLALLLVACDGICLPFYCPPTPTRESAPEPEPIGAITSERSDVFYGSSLANLTAMGVQTSRELQADGALRVTNGGKALLDFGFGLLVRAYNAAELTVAVSDEPSSWLAQFYLNRSVVLGTQSSGGRPTKWRTPGGAEITITGTDFFIAYDPSSGETWVGNFGGSVEVNGIGGVANGTGVVWPSRDVFILTDSYATFEGRVDGAADPITVARSYPPPDEEEPPGNIEPPPETVNVLLTYSGYLAEEDLRSALLFAAPWASLANEAYPDYAVQVWFAPIFALDELQPVDDFPYDPDLAADILRENEYLDPSPSGIWTPLNFTLVTSANEGSWFITENALVHLHALKMETEVIEVPAVDFLEMTSTMSSAGESFWGIGFVPAELLP